MKALYLRFNRWAGFGPVEQGDLFSSAYRLGFATLFVCRSCLVERLQQLKAAVEEAEKSIESRIREFDGR